ncbi:DinB family protein [Flavobacterium pallidum]|uniref:DinB family protein n=1 Tax=Flavobacterium pallidum TaxID=2172098 RepID=A0A2S1SIT1_9FLAO|nr:DinB family protein [Flavobacterium pallidum]AWI26324.1 DinB family protein [Flavobacterium pallidum]
MEIKSIAKFIKYYMQSRAITNAVICVIPPDKMDWSYQPGKFTIADLIRHIAAIEREVFMEVIQGNKPAYKGCRKEGAADYEEVMSYFKQLHKESIEILSGIRDENLENEVTTLDGKTTTMGNFLRALIVHEVHHRAVLCLYLNLLGVSTPPVIGLMEEQVIEVSK